MKKRGLVVKFKKYVSWVICAGLLIACVGVGLLTRNSFTDVAHDNDLMNAPYWYYHQSPSSLNDGIEDLKQQSELIALIKTHGNKEYKDNSFLTKVDVQAVFQGNSELEGKSILLYEPIQLSYVAVDQWNEQDSIEMIKNLFPDLEETGLFINSIPETEAMYQHAPLQVEQEYLVFLVSKEYPKESYRYLQTEEYNFIDSMYAIIDINATENMFKIAPEFISLQEAVTFPVLLRKQSDLKIFIQKYKQIQNEFFE